ncbi:MAG: pyridoxamine 5'-phosphate oxidase [Gemmatimonadota bacterium]|jgi:pyridoxamine 5'-phosphate oxidase
MQISHLREEYRRASLDVADVAADPLAQFRDWFQQAQQAEVIEPNAMALATSDGEGHPNCRMVLLKEADTRGFVFFTDYRSMKGQEIDATAHAALCFWWAPLERQVRLQGRVERIDAAESAAYYKQRPRGSQLGAWASAQSSVLPDRETLEARHAELDATYPGDTVPLPAHWGGFRVIPSTYEFWQGRPSRLHDRIRYRLASAGDTRWVIERLSP